ERSVWTVSGSFFFNRLASWIAGGREVERTFNQPGRSRTVVRSGQPAPEEVDLAVRDTPVKLLARKSRPATTPALLLQVLGDPHWRAPRIQSRVQ
ncbi:hypothetical protein CORC01_03349, partial [Colletotrichum orchidophilum]